MSLDEQLRRAFDTLAQRLAEDISRHLTTTADTVRSAADAAGTAVAAEAAQQAWAAAEQATGERVAVLADARELTARQRVLKGMRAMDDGQSLREVFGALVASTRDDADRAAIILAEGSGAFQIECSRGFDLPGASGVDPSEFFGGGAAIVQAAQSGETVVLAAEDGSGLAAAVPLVVSRRVVGVLYAERGEGGEGSAASWATLLEVFTQHAARSLEAVTAMRLAASVSPVRGTSA